MLKVQKIAITNYIQRGFRGRRKGRSHKNTKSWKIDRPPFVSELA